MHPFISHFLTYLAHLILWREWSPLNIQYYYLICTRFRCIYAVSFHVVTWVQNSHKCRHTKLGFQYCWVQQLLNAHYLWPYESTSNIITKKVKIITYCKCSLDLGCQQIQPSSVPHGSHGQIQMGPSCETNVGPKLEPIWFLGGCKMGLFGGQSSVVYTRHNL